MQSDQKKPNWFLVHGIMPLALTMAVGGVLQLPSTTFSQERLSPGQSLTDCKLASTSASPANLIRGSANGSKKTQEAKQQEGKRQETELQATIRQVLSIQTIAWNEGNLEKFMSTYWKSDRLSFSSGGTTTYGWQGTLDRYKKGYAPPKEMGTLHFDHLEVSPIEKRSALVLGHWHLKMKDGSKRDGNFSLVLKQMDGQWKIIHDHSSIKEPEKTETEQAEAENSEDQ